MSSWLLGLPTASQVPYEFLAFVFVALCINQVTYSDRKFCRSVGPGFASLGTSR